MMATIETPGRYRGLDTDPVGATEIAAYAGVGLKTVQRWRERHSDFPAPRWTVGGRAAWRIGDISTWLLRTGRHPGWAAGTVRCRELADRTRTRLLETVSEWVTRAELLTLAPEGRHVVLTEVEDTNPFGSDDARGPAYDAGGTGEPDGSMLEDAITLLRKQLPDPDDGPAYRIEEGYPAGRGRSFRAVLI